jgi:5-methylcytosine-specific restriction protein A
MTRTLLRPCLGCGRIIRGKARCRDCQATQDQPKRARRPDLHNDAAERRRRERVVADHRALLGDWCPGWAGRPAHPAADLTADHVKEVAKGGHPGGRLVVRCRSCNAARSAHLARRALTKLAGQSMSAAAATEARVLSRAMPTDPSPGERVITHRADYPGPVVA